MLVDELFEDHCGFASYIFRVVVYSMFSLHIFQFSKNSPKIFFKSLMLFVILKCLVISYLLSLYDV